jgi:hypothetical protein
VISHDNAFVAVVSATESMEFRMAQTNRADVGTTFRRSRRRRIPIKENAGVCCYLTKPFEKGELIKWFNAGACSLTRR